MRLYYAAASPFVRKVVMALRETDQIDDVEIVSVMGTAVDPGSLPLSHNPLGKIPALERDDGPAIYDSRVICRYFDDRAGGKLYPTDNRLWDVLTLEATADGMMESAVLMVYEGRVRPVQYQYPVWVDAQWQKISRAIEALNTRWISHLVGPLDMGQIAVACALGYCDFRHPERDWRADNPALADWFAEFSKRESFQATIPTA